MSEERLKDNDVAALLLFLSCRLATFLRRLGNGHVAKHNNQLEDDGFHPNILSNRDLYYLYTWIAPKIKCLPFSVWTESIWKWIFIEKERIDLSSFYNYWTSYIDCSCCFYIGCGLNAKSGETDWSLVEEEAESPKTIITKTSENKKQNGMCPAYMFISQSF